MNRRNEGDKSISKTRFSILQAVFSEFTEKGYKAATTKAIASAAGINELTLYRHFGSKRKLFITLMQQLSTLPDSEIKELFHVTGNLRGDLQKIGEQFLAFMIKSRKIIIMAGSEAVSDRRIARIIEKTSETQNRLFSGYFSDLIRKGVLRSDIDPRFVAQAFCAPFVEYAMYSLVTGEKVPSQQKLQSMVAKYVDLFISGVGR